MRARDDERHLEPLFLFLVVSKFHYLCALLECHGTRLLPRFPRRVIFVVDLPNQKFGLFTRCWTRLQFCVFRVFFRKYHQSPPKENDKIIKIGSRFLFGFLENFHKNQFSWIHLIIIDNYVTHVLRDVFVCFFSLDFTNPYCWTIWSQIFDSGAALTSQTRTAGLTITNFW